ncbi:Rv3654c family TadE-like protein [Bifidobacterium cuniculi]|uniref:TadE-like protein n=1 Tax=Bifidobacterium cuniculi TaxID=1688 RepID=A0A087B2R6_9BIFI|nr:Rv3654c family TadE-like protein [Bifidobacterium cuniculi]KFI65316.1 TadE-like protein [Bifidobacterium cuniculi]
MRDDEGSATMAGAGLVAAAALLLSALAMGGALVVRQAQAQSAADLAALAGAQALWESSSAPCAVAVTVGEANGTNVDSCEVDGDDVQVLVRMDTGVPMVPTVAKHARAGPRECA